MAKALRVALGTGRAATEEALAAVRASGLDAALAGAASGPFGQTSTSLGLLEAIVESVDLGLVAASALEGLVLEDAAAGSSSFGLPRLSPAQQALVSAFQLVVMADALEEARRPTGERLEVEGALEPEGLEDLLEEPEAAVRARRLLALARAYLARQQRTSDLRGDLAAARAVRAFFVLLRRAVLGAAERGSLRPLVRALAGRSVVVGGRAYDGLAVRAEREPSGLLPVRPEHVVGNDGYLEAGLRLARDVSGYDFELRRNPKRLNPILFGLGRPGCGKTVTAHAIGNVFLDHCLARGVPARFVVVRRTDWASSYQNASASNLVRIFRDEVHGFEGVAGVYWPDIDTAFASRASDDLRMEEKQNLAAVFGVFDGTLIPRDGKWFMICDANTLHMDEATVSRIAQAPHEVHGPTTAADYVRLMREVMLGDLAETLPPPEAWAGLGELAASLGLSGRDLESVCNRVRAAAQDFDFPDAYYAAGAEERERIVRSLARPVSRERILELLRERAEFQAEAAERAEQAAFEREVQAIVRHLNASREAAGRAVASRGRGGG